MSERLMRRGHGILDETVQYQKYVDSTAAGASYQRQTADHDGDAFGQVFRNTNSSTVSSDSRSLLLPKQNQKGQKSTWGKTHRRERAVTLVVLWRVRNRCFCA
jgi:hypothetical protein